MSQRAVFGVYLALLVLQPVWHFLLPIPLGSGSWILAAIASLPLLLPLGGIAKGSFRGMTWGGFLAVLYFVIGVMEAWSNPDQRYPALLQIVLALSYCGLLAIYSRQPHNKNVQQEQTPGSSGNSE